MVRASPGGRVSVAVFSGEPSGDINAADLVEEMRRLRPAAEFWGVGGSALRRAGVRIEFDSTEWGAMGVWEALKLAPRLHGYFQRCRERLTMRQPPLVVLVDFGAFNSRVARVARALGSRVFWYFPPRSWSRSPHAAGDLAELTDGVATPFPWSEAILRAAGVNARWVGHPLVERARAEWGKERFCREVGLDPGRPIVLFLPASRRAELRYIWPAMAAAAAEIERRVPTAQPVVGLAPALSARAQELAARHPTVRLTDRIYDALHACDAVVTKSGTVTLEAICFLKPMVVLYRGSWLAELEYHLWHRKRIRFIAMPNIIADAAICPELIQHQATPAAIAEPVCAWLTDPAASQPIREALAQVKAALGPPGATRRAAEFAWSVLESTGRS